jgi:hypothetical protein
VAGLADLIADPSPGELRWWIGIFKQTGVRWRDYAASADPVPNGALLDEQCPFPEHRTVHNRGSLLRDHTTYWTNRDEFVVEVVRCLAELDPLVAPDLAGHDEDFAFARRRRRWRVAWLTGARWVAVAGIMAALVHKWAQWLPLAGQVPGHLAASAGIGTRPDTVELDETAIALWPAAAVLAAYLLVGLFWRTLDRAETDRLLARRRPVAQAAEFGFVLGLDVLVLVAVWAAAPAIFSGWLAWAVVVGQLVLWFATQTRMRAYAPSDEAPEEHEARGVRAGRTLRGLFGALLLYPWVGWSGFHDCTPLHAYGSGCSRSVPQEGGTACDPQGYGSGCWVSNTPSSSRSSTTRTRRRSSRRCGRPEATGGAAESAHAAVLGMTKARAGVAGARWTSARSKHS